MSPSKPNNAAGPVMIEAVGLSKYYGRFAAIDGVSFSMRQGEVVAFLGPNGAGKSTTMKLLTGYLAPSAGIARIAGHDMASDRLAGRREARLSAREWPPLSRHDAPRPCSSFLPTPAGCRARESATAWTPSSINATWGP